MSNTSSSDRPGEGHGEPVAMCRPGHSLRIALRYKQLDRMDYAILPKGPIDESGFLSMQTPPAGPGQLHGHPRRVA